MRPSKVFFLNSAAREQIFQRKLARESHKAADPCYRKFSYMKTKNFYKDINIDMTFFLVKKIFTQCNKGFFLSFSNHNVLSCGFSLNENYIK